jgi:hypothetical protein
MKPTHQEQISNRYLMTPPYWADPMSVPFTRCFLGITVVGLLLVSVGCSVLGPNQSKRKVPLPEGVEPSDLFNSHPANDPVADITPYIEKDPNKKTAPVSSSKSSTQRQKQTQYEKNIAPSEFGAPSVTIKEREQKKLEQSKRQLSQQQFETVKKTVNEFAKKLEGIPGFLAENIAAPKLNVQGTDSTEPVLPGARYNFLLLSGGVAHGAYQTGVLCGLNDQCKLPTYDVVTGVSTGSLVAALVFPGAEYLPELKRIYTTVKQGMLRGEVWKVKAFPPAGLGTDSLASSEPLRKLLKSIIDRPGYYEKVVAEHAKGRRLYVGTTNLDTGRFVAWDMGAIATEGSAKSRKLFEDILLASAAMPPLLSPQRINITIDDKEYEEFHVDGGTTRNLFFYPPSDWPGEAADKLTGNKMLSGATLHIILAGKTYHDPEGTNPKLVSMGIRCIGTLHASCQRGELARIYSNCKRLDMKYNIADIPDEFGELFPPTEFNSEKMTKLFNYAYQQVVDGTVWNTEPPERAVSEVRARRSTELTTKPNNEIGPLPPARRFSPAPVVTRFGSFTNR